MEKWTRSELWCERGGSRLSLTTSPYLGAGGWAGVELDGDVLFHHDRGLDGSPARCHLMLETSKAGEGVGEEYD